MRVEAKPVSSMLVVWAIATALIIVLTSAVLHAQDDRPIEDLSIEELQEQRESLIAEAAAAASTVDVFSSNVGEIEQALEEMAELSNLHQLRLSEAEDRHATAVRQYSNASEQYEETLASIEELEAYVAELSVAVFTGEANANELDVALFEEPGEAARFLHLLGLQTGDVGDSLDRLRLQRIQAEELIAERDSASQRAQDELTEVDARTAALTVSIAKQEELLRLTESRLVAELLEADSVDEQTEALESIIADLEERLENAVQGIGSPAPVDRADIVLLKFFGNDSSVPIFQIQVHKDIAEETRGLYELAFSQGINLGGWGYRNTERQIELRESHCGSSSYDIWLRPASQCSPPTARPGYSKHEQGRAIDFQWNGGSIGPRSGEPFQWLAANAPQFGFVNLPSEPWHWSDGSGVGLDPLAPPLEIPADAFIETEPDADSAELLGELADLGDVAEDCISIDGTVTDGTAADGAEALDPEAATPEAPAPEALATDGAEADGTTTGCNEAEGAGAEADATAVDGTEVLDPGDPEAEASATDDPAADGSAADGSAADGSPGDGSVADGAGGEQPANPAPANPEPANPAPANPEPANPAPANPQPANPEAGDTAVEPAAVEPEPAGASPAETAPPASVPEEPVVEEAAVEQAPAAEIPVDETVAEPPAADPAVADGG